MLTLLVAVPALVATQAPQAKPATNTKCPVMGEAVVPGKSPKTVVRGREYYLCCKGCAAKLQADPDKYLDKDGTPKNAR
jgi:YHS domain-containing protein